MKTNTILILILFTAFFLKSSTEKSYKSEIPVGTVINSLLPPEYFLSNNPEWVLLDGRELKSEWDLTNLLHEYGDYDKNTLPNALGQFIRTMNYNGKGLDEDKYRKVGSNQVYSTALPKSSKFKSGNQSSNHSHSYSDAYFAEIDCGNQGLIGNVGPHDHDNGRCKSSLTTGDNRSNHHHNIVEGGDFETRPVNVALYSYIKVSQNRIN